MSGHRQVWFELMTTDTAAAAAFYGAVVGWKTQVWDAGSAYTMWVAPHGPVGGLMTLPEAAKAMGAPPHWLSYVGVASCDETAARVVALGGKVYVPPTDLPNAGRFAVFADPQGAAFGVHQNQNPSAPKPKQLGDFMWSELMSTDPEAAFAFYAELFGWVKTGAMDMGPMGTYQLYGEASAAATATDDAAAGSMNSLGGMMRCPPGMPVSAWLNYAFVADLQASLATVRELGGTVMNGPQPVPGGAFIAQCCDPQGAMFALLSDKLA